MHPEEKHKIMADKKKLEHAAHLKFWENARPWLVLIGATSMTLIGCYVFAQPNLTAISLGKFGTNDVLVVIITAMLGLLLDAAIVISGSRATMPRRKGEGWYHTIANICFWVILLSEFATLIYFLRLISPDGVDANILDLIGKIHNALFFVRSFLPPFIVAYLAVWVRELTYERSDLKHAMKATSSQELMRLQGDLTRPAAEGETIDRGDLVKQFRTQQALYQFATGATSVELAEDEQLYKQFCDTYGVAFLSDNKADYVKFGDLDRKLQDFGTQSGDATRQAIDTAIDAVQVRVIGETTTAIDRHATTIGDLATQQQQITATLEQRDSALAELMDHRQIQDVAIAEHQDQIAALRVAFAEHQEQIDAKIAQIALAKSEPAAAAATVRKPRISSRKTPDGESAKSIPPDGDQAEALARRFWEQGMGAKKLMILTDLSQTAAAKYVRIFKAELARVRTPQPVPPPRSLFDATIETPDEV